MLISSIIMHLSSSPQAGTGNRLSRSLAHVPNTWKCSRLKIVSMVSGSGKQSLTFPGVFLPRASLDARLAVMSARMTGELLGALMERKCVTASATIPAPLIDIFTASLVTTVSGRKQVTVLPVTTDHSSYLYCAESHEDRLNASSLTWSVP